jgi:hypothetical protein
MFGRTLDLSFPLRRGLTGDLKNAGRSGTINDDH